MKSIAPPSSRPASLRDRRGGHWPRMTRRKAQRMTYDYPSGHAAWGWTWATILAAIAPDRAQQILARGKAYGASRVVCGAHNASSIDASIKMTTATMAA